MSMVTLGSDIPQAYRAVAPEGIVYVKAPNGRDIPVGVSQYHTDVGGQDFADVHHHICDSRDVVSISQNPIRSNLYRRSYVNLGGWPHQFPYRALEGVDYSQYGFTKIGRIWLDPQDSAEVEFATKALNGAAPIWILCAKGIESANSWMVEKLDPNNKRQDVAYLRQDWTKKVGADIVNELDGCANWLVRIFDSRNVRSNYNH